MKVKFYFAKVSRKFGIIIIICKGLLPTAWPGFVSRDIFAKVPRKLCERAGEN